jgi:hypothetical protein
VEDSRGNEALLKEVRPVAKGSGEPLAHITFQKRADKKKREEEPTEKPRFTEGGSSGSRDPPETVLSAQRFSEAQARRADPVSAHIMAYERKTTDEQRRQAEAKKEAAKALREAGKKERIDKSVAAEVAKQQRQLERMIKQNK